MGYRFGDPYSLLLLGNTVVLAGVAVLLGRYRTNRGAQGVIGVLVGAAIWSLADALKLAATTGGEVLFWNKMSYLGVVIVPPAFLLFVAVHTDHDEWLKRRYAAPVLAVSVLAFTLVITNQWHGLWRTGETVLTNSQPPALLEELGVVHMLWNIYVLLVVVPVGIGTLVARLRDNGTPPMVKRQTLVVLLGILAPVITSALFATRVLHFDLTPFGFGLAGLAMSIAIARYRLFGIVPLARDVVLENIDSGVLVVDSDDFIVDANARAVTILETTKDDLVGQTMPALVDSLSDIPAYLGTATDREETIAVPRDSGETEYYDVHISPVRPEDRATAGRVIMFSNVTAQVRQQETLKEQKIELERQNERLDEFAGLVSHDLRNPLQIISANLALIDESEHEDQLQSIAEATERMEEIVDQVLTIARTGGDVHETEIVELQSMAQQVWDAASDGNGTLNVETTTTVDADPRRLRQCFENLFRNAVEHADDSVTVTIGDRDGGFYVEDDGPGFPEAALAADQSVVDYYAEKGRYGLQIVRNVIDAHGWELRITNGEVGGARFEILID